MMFDAMTMENILEHYKNPHNKGRVASPHIYNTEKNPACGDEISITVQLNKQKEILDIKFEGHGCAISQASTSILTDELKGKKIDDVMKLTKQDVLGLLGIEVSPLRIKCAMLGLRVLQRGILKYEGKNAANISLTEI